MERREQLRATFDATAETYDAVRPRYPAQLYDDLATLAGLVRGARVLEVGPGPGIATVELARRGYAIDAIELGENMAAVARRALASYPQVHVRVGTFEQADIAEGIYDLVTSATAWHWVDPAVRYVKAARSLRPGGAVAPFWSVHVHTDADGGFFEQVQQVYDRLTPELTQGYQPLQRVDQLPESEREAIEESGLFDTVAVRRYGWDEPYTTAQYVALLNTYSNHRALDDQRRQQLFDAVAALIDTAYSGRIVKGYGAMLYVAQRA